MSIVSVPLSALPAHPAAAQAPELAAAGLIDNDRKALHLTEPWHAEVLTHARTGAVLLTPCDCMLGHDHSYGERMSWPAGLMRRDLS